MHDKSKSLLKILFAGGNGEGMFIGDLLKERRHMGEIRVLQGKKKELSQKQNHIFSQNKVSTY